MDNDKLKRVADCSGTPVVEVITVVETARTYHMNDTMIEEACVAWLENKFNTKFDSPEVRFDVSSGGYLRSAHVTNKTTSRSETNG
ncbi:MAG: hypothetical protein WC869_01130 [Phycisphaerae bacterium]|jgi:hypothetical protein